MKKIVSSILVLLFILSILVITAGFASETGYSSPDEVVMVYLNSLKETNIEGMLGTFAVENYVDNFNFEHFLSRIGFYSTTFDVKLPTTNDFIRDIAIYDRLGAIADAIELQYLALFAADSVVPGERTQLMSNSEISELTSLLGDQAHLQSLQSLDLIEYIAPDDLSELYSLEINQQTIQNSAASHGADEITSVAARVKIDGNDYLFCFETVCYNGDWYLLSLGGNLSLLLEVPVLSSGILPL